MFSDGRKMTILNELVKKYPECLLNVNMIDLDYRNNHNEIEIDFRFKYFNKIVNYMSNDYDINELNGIEFDEFCVELIEMNIPFRSDIMNRLYNGCNEYGVGWKNRCLMMNGNEYKLIVHYVQSKLHYFKYDDEKVKYEINESKSHPMNKAILDDFEQFLNSPSKYMKNEELKIDVIIDLLYKINIDIYKELRNYLLNYTRSLFCYGSKILDIIDYDTYLKEWLGNDCKWKLLYRASEHDYLSDSFHEYCDDVKGPTLVIIKSSEGWIFGGYTTQSWAISRIGRLKDDDKAFIFTLKNPHGVEPTRFMKRKGDRWAISCNYYYGPAFGKMFIIDKCNEKNSCWIDNNGTGSYECHPQYKSSLFVNTAGPNEDNYFSVLDYEVYCIDNESKYTIDHKCKYPDIIGKYIETDDLSEELLKEVDDDVELFNDLDALYIDDFLIKMKISQYCLKSPSKLLVNSQLVNENYDKFFEEWLGSDYQWTLLYRASEHEYTAQSFHEYCDNKGPTLVIIKNVEGSIFGGYTTQSWSGKSINFFLFVND